MKKYTHFATNATRTQEPPTRREHSVPLYLTSSFTFEDAEQARALFADEYVDRFFAPAGLTGLWQEMKRGNGGEMSPEERKQLDIQYAQTFSFWLDVKIIF